MVCVCFICLAGKLCVCVCYFPRWEILCTLCLPGGKFCLYFCVYFISPAGKVCVCSIFLGRNLCILRFQLVNLVNTLFSLVGHFVNLCRFYHFPCQEILCILYFPWWEILCILYFTRRDILCLLCFPHWKSLCVLYFLCWYIFACITLLPCGLFLMRKLVAFSG